MITSIGLMSRTSWKNMRNIFKGTKMNYKKQKEEWLKAHPEATIDDAWEAGYRQCTQNWCDAGEEYVSKQTPAGFDYSEYRRLYSKYKDRL